MKSRHPTLPLLLSVLILISAFQLFSVSSFAQNRTTVVCDELVTGKVGFAATSFEYHPSAWIERDKSARDFSHDLYLKIDSLTAAYDATCSLRVAVIYGVENTSTRYTDVGSYGTAGEDTLLSPYFVCPNPIGPAGVGFVWHVPKRAHDYRQYQIFINDTANVRAIEKEQKLE